MRIPAIKTSMKSIESGVWASILEWSMWTSGVKFRPNSQFFGGSIFELGGVWGIDLGMLDHPRTILKTDPDPPIPDGQKIERFAMFGIEMWVCSTGHGVFDTPCWGDTALFWKRAS